MFKTWFPDSDTLSPYGIDYDKLYAKGYRGVIYDIDNTIVPHGAPATEEAVLMFERVRKAGLKTMLLSNNKEERVKPFADAVKSPYIYKASKPSTKGYLKAMELMNTDADSTVFVGDQLFTDIWGAKRSGIKTILVRPIDPHEEIQIILKRYPERLILYFYNKYKKKNSNYRKIY